MTTPGLGEAVDEVQAAAALGALRWQFTQHRYLVAVVKNRNAHRARRDRDLKQHGQATRDHVARLRRFDTIRAQAWSAPESLNVIRRIRDEHKARLA